MCENYKYMLQIKPEYDVKFKTTGIHSQMVYLCEVKDVANGNFKLNYDKKRFNLLVKECGKCHVCRFKKASIKACQAQSEYKTAGKGSFITLTFGKEQLTDYIMNDRRYLTMSNYKKKKYINYLQWTLEKQEFIKFMKRLRAKCYNDDLRDFSIKNNLIKNLFKLNGEPRKKVIQYKDYDYSNFKPRKIRFMHCGEYGEFKQRPHHHAIIFGIDFSFDKSEVRYSWKLKRNKVVHFNNILNDLWKFGDVTTDKVNYQTCNYVARYITKKVVNKNKVYIDRDIAGSIYKGRLEEYCTQSNRKGLGYDYYMQNSDKINKDLKLCFKNNKGEIKYCPLPRYFKELMKRYYKQDFLRMQKLSIEKQEQFSNTLPKLLENRMLNDEKKGFEQFIRFKGDLEKTNFNSSYLDYLSFNLKKQVFDDYNSIQSVYLSTYKDTDFINKEYWRITCYKNFEKYRRCLKTRALQDYVFNKGVINPSSGLMLDLYKKRQMINFMDNPFNKDLLDIYAANKDFDLRDRFIDFERSKCYA